MVRDITIGQYYPENSVIHKLDPRVKLAGTLIFIVSLFLFSSFMGYVAVILFLGIVIKLSKVPFKFIIKGLRAIFILLLFTVVFNMFLTPGRELVHIFGSVRITEEGLRIAIFMGIRLILLIIGSSVLTLTTSPNQLTDGMEKGLSIFKRIGLPVHEIAMMMSIALRFIPILLEETDKIMKAQSARGADFETGGFINKAKALIPILVPLFVSAFRRAIDLAMAMEARCYHGGEGRTKMKPLQYKSRDRVAYITCFAYVFILIVINIVANKFIGV
ncbi:MAG: energy-coupling factor transporter transmembrane component T family protein [Catonella sp.]|uniref:energy-coupling factor transporter transmembrane component T family protein n=1 Tax=Catonella sp. TaxID=2382125 RepID=UPI003FA11CC9